MRNWRTALIPSFPSHPLPYHMHTHVGSKGLDVAAENQALRAFLSQNSCHSSCSCTTFAVDFYSCQAWNVSGARQTSANFGCRSRGSGRCNCDPAFIWKVGRCLCSSGVSSFHSFNNRASWDIWNPSVAGLRLSTATHSTFRELLCFPQKPGSVWLMMRSANMRQNGPILCLLLWYLVTTSSCLGLEGVCRT